VDELILVSRFIHFMLWGHCLEVRYFGSALSHSSPVPEGDIARLFLLRRMNRPENRYDCQDYCLLHCDAAIQDDVCLAGLRSVSALKTWRHPDSEAGLERCSNMRCDTLLKVRLFP
jgi:hypothetical protein